MSIIKSKFQYFPIAGFVAGVLWLGGIAVQQAALFAYPQSTDPNPPSFVNWETPHVHPLDITPDGTKLLAVNTADNRLEVYDISGASSTPVSLGSIPVGLDPVSVRARNNNEAWVVNHLSDSISVVNLLQMNVVATLQTEDEPADVIFAGSPQRAFVSGAQASKLMVFNPANLAAPPTVLDLEGEEPRAMAVSPDRSKVYIGFFESGNKTTVVGTHGQGGASGHLSSPYGGQNPPPNVGAEFVPAINPDLPITPPKSGVIVRKNSAGNWMDDNNGDWTPLVSGSLATASRRVAGWDVIDNDVAVVDANTLQVSYLGGMMNLVMAIGVNPANSQVTVVGTEATNQVRFEPNLKGRFVRVNAAFGDAANLSVLSVVDLNPHLDYSDAQIATQSDPARASQALRDRSIGDPRAIVWNAQGSQGFVSGMGSNNVVVINAAGARSGSPIVVGEGPTGLAFRSQRNWLYVLNKFEGSISVVDVRTRGELARAAFFDPTPAAIKTGRKHLYDTHRTSGLGQVACASCHIDGKSDRLSWDLGDPAGTMKSFGQNCFYALGRIPACGDFHPMKGPLFTQTLQDIIGKEPHHWRGDKTGLEQFDGAFTGLQGDDVLPTATDMQELKDFLATIFFPPNPYRNFDNSLPTSLALPGHFSGGSFRRNGGLARGAPLPVGDATRALDPYRTVGAHLNGFTPCVQCHTFQSGLGADLLFVGNLNQFPNPGSGVYETIAPGPDGERHLTSTTLQFAPLTEAMTLKVPHLRALYKKVGFELTQSRSRAGFGFLRDGGDTLAAFVEAFPRMTGDQQIADFVALLLSYAGSDLPTSTDNLLEPAGPRSQDTHAAVGKQVTFNANNINDPALIARLGEMTAQADAGKVGLVAKGRRAGVQRGWVYQGSGLFQSDRVAQTIATDSLRLGSGRGAEVTFTVVPYGNQTRIGVDRDGDGIFDGDDAFPTSSAQTAGSRTHNIQAARFSTPGVARPQRDTGLPRGH